MEVTSKCCINTNFAKQILNRYVPKNTEYYEEKHTFNIKYSFEFVQLQRVIKMEKKQHSNSVRVLHFSKISSHLNRK